MNTNPWSFLSKVVLVAVTGAVVPGCSRASVDEPLRSETIAPAVDQTARPVLAATVEALIPRDDATRSDAPSQPVREIHMPLAWIYARAPHAARAADASDARAALDRDLRPGASPTIAQALALGGTPAALPLVHAADAGLSPASVARALRVADDRIEACYATVLRDHPSARGDVHVDAVVDRDGRVRAVHQRTHDLGAASIMPCIANGFVGMQLAPPASRFVEVSRTLSLHG